MIFSCLIVFDVFEEAEVFVELGLVDFFFVVVLWVARLEHRLFAVNIT